MKTRYVFYVINMILVLLSPIAISFSILLSETSSDSAIYMLVLSFVFFIVVSYPMLNMLYRSITYKFKLQFFILIHSIISILTMYTLLYIAIYNYDNNSFVGINIAKSSFDTYIDFLYFSTVTFTTLGYGDIYPASSLAKIACILEVITFAVYISIVIGVLRNNQKVK